MKLEILQAILGGISHDTMFIQAMEALNKQRIFSGLREYVFINKNGTSYYGANVLNNAFKRLIKDSGIRAGTIHDLRRSFNTLLKQYGYPTDWILDVMGHADDKVNRNHYTGNINVDMSKIGNIAI